MQLIHKIWEQPLGPSTCLVYNDCFATAPLYVSEILNHLHYNLFPPYQVIQIIPCRTDIF